MEIVILIALVATALCVYMFSERWKAYDPNWLLDMAVEQYPEDVELHNALKKCIKIKGNNFVSSRNANQPGAEWQFEKSITLVHPEMDDIILDVLKDGRVGSIEYLGLMCRE